MTQYTQTTTADEPIKPIPSFIKGTNGTPCPYCDMTIPYIEQPNKQTIFKNPLYIFASLCLLTLIVAALCFWFYNRGRSEAETEQAIKTTQAKIDTIYTEKEVKATNVRQQSNNAAKASKIIREGVIVNVPEYKPTSQDSMIQYLKKLKP